MNAAGAVVFDPQTGDPRRQQGFVVDVSKPAEITVHGNYRKGFYVTLKDAGVELGPYAEPWQAHAVADRYAGVLERAN